MFSPLDDSISASTALSFPFSTPISFISSSPFLLTLSTLRKGLEWPMTHLRSHCRSMNAGVEEWHQVWIGEELRRDGRSPLVPRLIRNYSPLSCPCVQPGSEGIFVEILLTAMCIDSFYQEGRRFPALPTFLPFLKSGSTPSSSSSLSSRT
jgi:hypothetical protein